jgi:oligopeptide/dipeptide ABC transporter ATP-binding protein
MTAAAGAGAAAPALMTLQALAVRFAAVRGPAVQAVHDVSLTLAAGRVLALIGESGSGKSTVLLAIAGLLGRRAQVADNLLAADADRRGIAGRSIGMVFQNPGASLNPVLAVGDQVDEVVMVHRGLGRREARAVTLALMERVGIGDAARRAAAFPHQLSGGLKQRIAIAAALAAAPRLMLADEPTTALDATVQAQIFDLLLDLVARERMGLLLVTHDMAVAGSVADEFAVMYAGRIVEHAAARTLVAHPAHPYSAALVAAALPLAPGARVGAGRDAPFPELPPDDPGGAGAGCAFASRCPRATALCRVEPPPAVPTAAGVVACHHPLAEAP